MKHDIAKQITNIEDIVLELESIYLDLENILGRPYAEDLMGEEEMTFQDNILSSMYELELMYKNAVQQYYIMADEFAEETLN